MRTRSTSGRVAVVGGGIVGLAVAHALARRGVTCTVLERDRMAGGATHAAGGMLSPRGEAPDDGPFLHLALESLRRYPEWVAGLEGGADGVGFRLCGKLLVAFDEPGAAALRRRAAWQREAGLDVRLLQDAAARGVEAGVAPDVTAALHLPGDGVVDNRRLGPALARAAARAGAHLREGAPVSGLDVRGGVVAGVQLEGGERVEADTVVLAAGAWSGGLEGLPRRLPVRPVRGQMLALAPTGRLLDRVVGAPGAYLIPRNGPDGLRVVVGATQEEVGFREGNDPDAVAALHRAAVRAVPALSTAPVVERWWGFRPGTPDDLPVLGPEPELPGLVYATGHFRNGILLAPATAYAVERLVLDGEAPGLDPFRPGRFET